MGEESDIAYDRENSSKEESHMHPDLKNLEIQ